MLWLDTPLALSEDLQHGLSDEEVHVWLKNIAQTWTSRNVSVNRVYIFFGYDEGLELGDGMICVGYRFRLMKLPSGGWESVNIAAWAEVPDHAGSAFFASFYHPFDGLPGILPADLEHFPDI